MSDTTIVLLLVGVVGFLLGVALVSASTSVIRSSLGGPELLPPDSWQGWSEAPPTYLDGLVPVSLLKAGDAFLEKDENGNLRSMAYEVLKIDHERQRVAVRSRSTGEQRVVPLTWMVFPLVGIAED